MNSKVSVCGVCVEAIIYLFLFTLKDIKNSKLNLKRFSHTVRETKPLVAF